MNEKSPKFGEQLNKQYIQVSKAKYKSKSGEIKDCKFINGRYYIPKEDI